MAKEFLHKEGLTKLVENIKTWSKGVFLAKDATITKSSGTNKGVSVSIQGSVSEPSVSVSVTTSGVSENNSGIVSGSEVKGYVDKNAATKDTFKAATSSSNAVNGLVPAPSSANATKFLRGDGTWSVPPLATNNTDGLMSTTDKITLDQSVAMVTPMTGEDGSCVLEVERNDGTYLEFPVPKVGSAKEADNALNLDGVPLNRIHEFSATGFIDIGTSFSNATGWFRIARARYLRSTPSVFRVAIYRNYSYAAPEAYVFDVCTSYNTYDPISITQVAGQASTDEGNKLIDKIRVTRDTSSPDTILYFDFHVNLSKTRNQFFWYVIGNAESYTSSAVVRNPTITSTTKAYEFTTVNGFKTNGDIYEGDSSLSSKYIQTTKSISTSAANKGVQVKLGGTVGSPTLTVTTTTGGVASNNTGVVSGAEVKEYVDATIYDIKNGNITAAKSTTADSANAIGGKSVDDLVQGGGMIKYIKVVTALPANPSNDTLYLIKR